jgi:hypothetical protein
MNSQPSYYKNFYHFENFQNWYTCEKCSGIIFQLILPVMQTGTLFKKVFRKKKTFQNNVSWSVQFTRKVIKRQNKK